MVPKISNRALDKVHKELPKIIASIRPPETDEEKWDRWQQELSTRKKPFKLTEAPPLSHGLTQEDVDEMIKSFWERSSPANPRPVDGSCDRGDESGESARRAMGANDAHENSAPKPPNPPSTSDTSNLSNKPDTSDHPNESNESNQSNQSNESNQSDTSDTSDSLLDQEHENNLYTQTYRCNRSYTSYPNERSFSEELRRLRGEQ